MEIKSNKINGANAEIEATISMDEVNKNLEIILNKTDIEKICRYVKEYGVGGAQTKFLNIFKNYLECF